MTWTPMTPRWPKQACQWANGLIREGADVADVLEQGRQMLQAHFDHPIRCMTLTPFQPAVGQGEGQQRFLSASNLLAQLGSHLLDFKATEHDNHALVIMCLATNAQELAEALSRLNRLLPTPQLQRCERRAKLLATLEQEKWHKPIAASLPQWGDLPKQALPITRQTRQALAARLNLLEATVQPPSVPMALNRLADRKLAYQHAREQDLTVLQGGLQTMTPDLSLRVRRVGPGDPRELRRQLLDGAAPGHEWIMCAGLMMVGSAQALAFVSELVGL